VGAVVNFTDEQADKIEAAFSELGIGLTVDDVIITQDTIEQFKAARSVYRELGRITTDRPDALVVKGVQVAAGQPRTDLFVIDCGKYRAAYF
jgi:hypothetical protein